MPAVVVGVLVVLGVAVLRVREGGYGGPATRSVPVIDGSVVPRVGVFSGLPALDATLFNGPPMPVARLIAPDGKNISGSIVGYAAGRWWIEGDQGLAPLDRSVSALDLGGSAVLSFTEGEGARWVYERDFRKVDQQYRLERYSESSPTVVQDNPVPTGGQPAGPLAVGDGGVWIPLRGGVARMDTRTGRLVAELSLPFSEYTSLAVLGSRIVVSDGNAIRTIDPANNAVSPARDVVPAGQGTIYGLASVGGHLWVDVHREEGSTWLYRLDDSLRVSATLQVPVDSGGFALNAADGRLWLVAVLRIGVPDNFAATDQAIVLIDTGHVSVARTVVLHGHATSVAWTAQHELLLSDLSPSGSAGGPLDSTVYKITF